MKKGRERSNRGLVVKPDVSRAAVPGWSAANGALPSSAGTSLHAQRHISPGGVHGITKQVHGNGRFALWPWPAGTAAPLICYDLRFPERFRAAARLGADLFIEIAAWPLKRIEHWLTLLRARAIENLAFVIGVNRTGSEPRFEYCGRSVVVNPHGEIIADAGTAETILNAQILHGDVAAWRAEFPALRDARWPAV